MLHDFVTAKRQQILERSRDQIATSVVPLLTADVVARAAPLFLAHMEDLFRHTEDPAAKDRAAASAPPEHGPQLVALGFTMSQAVHSYGTLWQVVADLLAEGGVVTSSTQYQTLSQALDVAIEETVSAYEGAHGPSSDWEGAAHLGGLAQELRNALTTAMTLSEILASGHVGFDGRTASLLARAHARMRDLIDRSLAEVRLRTAPDARHETLRISEVLDDVATAARVDAKARGIELQLSVEAELAFQADRQLLVAALANLVQNAIANSRENGTVHVRASANEGWLRIEVQLDRDVDPSEDPGAGLGLPVALHAVQVQGGRIEVRNVADGGCVFSLELPRWVKGQSASASAAH